MVRTGQAEHTSSGIPVSIIEGISSNSSNHAPCHCSAPDRHHRRPAPSLLLRAVADLMLLRVVAWLPAVAWLSAVSSLTDCVVLLPVVVGLPRCHLRALVYMRPAPDAKVGRGERVRYAALRADSQRLSGLLRRPRDRASILRIIRCFLVLLVLTTLRPPHIFFFLLARRFHQPRRNILVPLRKDPQPGDVQRGLTD